MLGAEWVGVAGVVLAVREEISILAGLIFSLVLINSLLEHSVLPDPGSPVILTELLAYCLQTGTDRLSTF